VRLDWRSYGGETPSEMLTREIEELLDVKPHWADLRPGAAPVCGTGIKCSGTVGIPPGVSIRQATDNAGASRRFPLPSIFWVCAIDTVT